MPRSSGSFVTLLALLLCSACRKDLPAPRDLAVAFTPPDTLTFTWTPPNEDVALVFEARIERASGEQPFATLTAAPRGSRTWSFTIPAGAFPACGFVDFRAYAIRDTRQSSYSNQVTWEAPPPPASIAAATWRDVDGPTTDPITVSWTIPIPPAYTLRVERAELNGAPTTHWTTLRPQYPDTGFVDTDVSPGVTYQYRVAYTGCVNKVWSVPAQSAPVAFDTPSVVVSGAPGQYLVSWRARPNASGYRLQRTDPYLGLVVTVPSSQLAFADTLDPAWPATAYQVIGLYEPGSPTPEVPSALARVPPFRIGSPPSALDASFRQSPAGGNAVRDPGGRIHVADGLGTMFFPYLPAGAIYRETDAGYEPHVLDRFIRFGYPPLAVDEVGGLHSAYLRGGATPSDPVTIMHEWHDGTAWRSEPVAPPVLSYTGGPWLGLGAGSVHVLWKVGEGVGMVHRVKTGSGWRQTDLPNPVGVRGLDPQFGVAPDGTAYLLTDLDLFALPAGGAWTSLGPPVVDSCMLLPANAGHAGVACLSWAATGFRDLHLIRQDGTGWSAPHLVWHWESPIFYGDGRIAAQASPDGSAAYFALVDNLRDGTGAIFLEVTPAGSAMLPLGYGIPYSLLSLGLTPAGKAWVTYAGSVFLQP